MHVVRENATSRQGYTKETVLMRGKTKKILIIEDELDILNFASRVLELEGYHILRAKDGDEGLTLAREKQIALVLLDLRLPKRDGWAVLQQMKAEPALSAIPVVVFTASAGLPQREKAFSMGAINYLVKPLSATSLKKAVTSAMEQQE